MKVINVMVLFNKLDDVVWGREDFTDEDSLGITGTIYSDRELKTPFNLTGYSLTFRLVSQGLISEDDDVNVQIVNAASGTWKYNPPSGRMLSERFGEVIIRLEKSGTQISAIGINGSSDLHIQQV